MIEKSQTSESDRSSRAKLFEVEIAGVPLRLKSAHDQETVNELVELVDRKVKEALPLTKTGSIQNASILASLHLAEEYLLLRRKAKVELERLEAKTLKVISELENSRMTGPSQGRTEKSDNGLRAKDLEAQTEIQTEIQADQAEASHFEAPVSRPPEPREPEAGL